MRPLPPPPPPPSGRPPLATRPLATRPPATCALATCARLPLLAPTLPLTSARGARPRVRSAHEADRAALLEEQRLKEEQRDALTAQLADLKAQTRSHRDNQIRAAHRLKELEAKLLVGGQSLLDQDEELRREQLRIDEEIEARRREEESLKQQLEAEEEARLGQEEHYSTLQEEVEAKTQKLKKLFAKFKAAQAEIKEVQEEYNREKEDILDTIRKLSKQQVTAGAVHPEIGP